MPAFDPKSSHIRNVAYDPASKQLSVTFHNQKVYTYAGVPQEAYANMQGYRSAGEYLHRVLKRNYKLLKEAK